MYCFLGVDSSSFLSVFDRFAHYPVGKHFLPTIFSHQGTVEDYVVLWILNNL